MISAGRKPRRRVADRMIAAIAIAEGLPFFTTNPDDYKGPDDLLTVVPVTRPTVLHDRCGLASVPHLHHAQRYGAVSYGHQRHGSRGHFRSARPADQHGRRQGPGDSQAQSAGSIPVIRSIISPRSKTWGFVVVQTN